MSKWKLNHLSYSCHLFSATSYIVIPNIIQFFLFFSIYWLTLSIEHSVWCDYTKILRLSSNNFELNGLETTSYNEEITFFNRSVCIFEIRNEICFIDISSNPLNGVSKWQNMNFGEIGYISSRFDNNNVTESNSKIFSYSLIHAYFSILKFVIHKGHNKCLFSFLTFDENGISFENLEFCHFSLTELH